MTAQAGKDFIWQVGDGATAETFATVGGQRTTSMAINGEAVDVSSKPDDWRKLGENFGIKSLSISAAGVFDDSAAEETVRALVVSGELRNQRIVYENGDMWEGLFLVTSLEYSGEHNGPQNYSVSLESSGEPTFTPA